MSFDSELPGSPIVTSLSTPDHRRCLCPQAANNDGYGVPINAALTSWIIHNMCPLHGLEALGEVQSEAMKLPHVVELPT